MPRKKYSNAKILVAFAFVFFPCGFTTFHVRVMTFSSLVELPCKENRFKGKTDGEIWKRSPTALVMDVLVFLSSLLKSDLVLEISVNFHVTLYFVFLRLYPMSFRLSRLRRMNKNNRRKTIS